MIKCAPALICSRETSMPRSRRPAISSSSTPGSTTTPLPITGTHSGRSTPLGIRWSAYDSSPMTTVWPALLPPW